MPDDDKSNTAAADAMAQVFPTDPVTWSALLLGMPSRNIAKMSDGSTRMPPRIIEKLGHQARLREQLMADIEVAIGTAKGGGMHVTVLRYAIQDVLRSKALEVDEDPL